MDEDLFLKTLMRPEPVGVEKVLPYNWMTMLEKDEKKIIKEVTESEYKYGFVSNFDTDTISPGLNENIIKTISKKTSKCSKHKLVYVKWS